MSISPKPKSKSQTSAVSTGQDRARSKYRSVFEQTIQPAHRNATLDYYKDQTIINELRATIESMSSDQPRGVILCGPVGSGKTSALSLLFQALLNHTADKLYANYGNFDFRRIHTDIAFPYMYFTHARLVKKLRDESGSQEAWWYKKFIFIDDYGVKYDDTKGWNLYLEQLFFDHRSGHELPMYVSTNYTVGELKSMRKGKQGIELQRIIDRLCDDRINSTIVLLGESGRKAK